MFTEDDIIIVKTVEYFFDLSELLEVYATNSAL